MKKSATLIVDRPRVRWVRIVLNESILMRLGKVEQDPAYHFKDRAEGRRMVIDEVSMFLRTFDQQLPGGTIIWIRLPWESIPVFRPWTRSMINRFRRAWDQVWYGGRRKGGNDGHYGDASSGDSRGHGPDGYRTRSG